MKDNGNSGANLTYGDIRRVSDRLDELEKKAKEENLLPIDEQFLDKHEGLDPTLG